MFTRRSLTAALAAGLAAPTAGFAGQPPAPTRLPLRVSYNRLWTPVKLDGKGPFRFMIDTGADDYVVDPGFAEETGLKKTLSRDVAGLVGDENRNVYWASQVVIGDALKDQNVTMISGHLGDFVVGAIPAWVLGAFTTELDFPAGEMRIYDGGGPPLDGFERVRLAHRERRLGGHLNAATIVDPSLMTDVVLNGKTLRVCIDTGSPNALTLYPPAVRRMGLWNADKWLPSPGRGVTGAFDGRTVRLDTLQFGGSTLERPLINLIDPTRTSYGSEEIDGLLGMDMIRRFNLVLDAKQHALWLKPNPMLGQVQRFDRSGLHCAPGADRRLRVVAVMPDSPAAKSGVEKGDVVLPHSKDGAMGFWWALSGGPGEVVQFDIERDGKVQPVQLVLKDLI